MIENDEQKYDWEDRSFAEKIKRSSSCYEPTVFEKKNIELIEKYLNDDEYTSRHMVNVHQEYLEHLLNKLKGIRKEEFSVCPVNAELDAEISRVTELSRRLAMKMQEF